MLIRILGSFLVGCTRNIKQTIDTRLHGVCALVAKLERLLCISCVFIDHFIDQILNRRDILRSAELQESITKRTRYRRQALPRGY
jgi:hypothetical protein